ncbi:site-2 protease family protein [Oscillatoria sp. FACHB-1406]|uniref:site-2 protease family protein n=1 Tax=Oscillatoria sp. FACHB-1406 TaxID=2692846 RepID=UPI0016835537|nr:site-2 protease family protein [Oscillatoria sp. FACHB-1406]MBD2579098.1 hypothetical protein [Oscillatoria sp. FACHB-1406]
MKVLLLVLVANILASAIDTVAIASVSLYLNLAVFKVSLFIRPKLLRLEKWGTTFEIGSIPIGGGIQFYNRENLPQISQRASRERDLALGSKILLEWLHPLERLLVTLSGAIVIFTICSLILTPQVAITALLSGFEQIIHSSFDSEYGRALFLRVESLLDSQPIWVVMSILLTKFLSLNLLPILPFHGGAILKEIIRSLGRRNFEFSPFFVQLSCYLAIILILRWVVMLIAFCILPELPIVF